MTLYNIIQIIMIAAAYFLFSNEFFKFTAKIKDVKVSVAVNFFASLIVYMWFTAASLLELPLVINWFVFLIILSLEVCFIFRFSLIISYALSVFCIIISLAVNILIRGTASILLNIPLNQLDKAMSSLKTIPIFLGFMVMALLFCILKHLKFFSMLERMLYSKKSLIFYASTESYIYIFLMIQLLAFTQSGEDAAIKLWVIKASLFSMLILVISIIYSLRVASLHYYMNKKREMRGLLIQEKEDINKLWKIAYTDILTGCGNRQLLDRRLEEYAGYGVSITLAFIDLNGLKKINDQYGHLEGDSYIISVAQALLSTIDGCNIDLFRYGGDEFIIISNTLKEEKLTELLKKVNELLKADSDSYYKSISYGVVHGDCTDYKKMIADADCIMYEYKQKYYKHMARA